eukprot:s4195_g4.t1
MWVSADLMAAYVWSYSGKAKQAKLEEQLGTCHSGLAEASHTVAQVQKFTQSVMTLPGLQRNEHMTANALAAQIQVDDPKIFSTVARNIFKETNPAEQIGDDELLEQEFPLHSFLQHGFFILKDGQDGAAKHQTKLDRAQKAYKRVTETVRRRKDLTAKSMKTFDKAEASREEILSKRNFVNRIRNKVKKPKKIREHDKMWKQED